MLTKDERDQLHQLVLAFIGLNPDPAVLADLAGTDVGRRVPAGLNGFRVAEWLVGFALDQPDPALFIRITATANGAGIVPELALLVTDLTADPSRWHGHALDELWVPDPPRWPFLDRAPLRAVLADMAGGGGPPAITVDAPGGQGKRTVCEYIRQVEARRGTFRTVVERELRAESGGDLLARIVFDVRSQFGLPAAPGSTHQEPERVGKIMAGELARQVVLEAPAVPVWLVLNLVDPAVDDDLLGFVDELLLRLQADPELAGRLRLVLLADDFARFELVNLPPVAQRHALPRVDGEAISQWLAAAAPGRSPARYAIAVEEVLAKVAQQQPGESARLSWLTRQCKMAYDVLTKAT